VRGIVIGGWEEGTPTFGEADIPPEFGQQLLEGDFDRFRALPRRHQAHADRREGGHPATDQRPHSFLRGREFVGQGARADNAFVCAGFTYGIAVAAEPAR
jgi:hypothetical protein